MQHLMATDNKTTNPIVPGTLMQPAPESLQSTKQAPLNDFVSALSSVDPKVPDADKNATSISDNNGGRIELTFDKPAPPNKKLIEK